MHSRRSSFGLRRRNRSGSSLFGALRRKNQHRESRNKIRSLLMFENLEHRRVLAALVGVDFDLTSSSVPTNWTSIGTQSTPFTQSNLVDEDGVSTPFDLTIVGAGGSITHAAAGVTAATIPTHTQSLSNIDGQVFTSNPGSEVPNPVTLTWSDLTAGADYEVYLFGLEGFFDSIQQDVQITGAAGTPVVNFTQNFKQGGLYINDEAGSSSRALSSYAEIVEADDSGQITIDITPNGFTYDVSLGGVAIREVTAAELTVSVAADSISEGDGPAATIVTVSRNSDTTNALTITLDSDDTTEAIIPPQTLSIPAGANFAQFTLDAVDDAIFDRSQTVTITATAAGHADGSDTVFVVDDDAVLTLSLIQDAVLESAGSGSVNVLLMSTTTDALTVNLVSSNPDKIAVPSTLQLIGGFAFFPLDVTDNFLDDGSEKVTITATANSYVDGADAVAVIDDESTAGLRVDIADHEISEGSATTATVSRLAAGPTDVLVKRGVSISDINSSESALDDNFGAYTVGFRRDASGEAPDPVLVHQVSLNSTGIDSSGIDADGFVSINADSDALNQINDSSFFDVYFDLTTTHTFTLTGRVFATADLADALAFVELSGPGTALSFSEVDNTGNDGGTTTINVTGTLDPGTYHLEALAQAFSEPNPPANEGPSAEAEFELNLVLEAAALTINLASDDTTEATVPVPPTITIPEGQTSSAPFNINAVLDGIVDGTQTVTITASATSHNDGSDTVDVTDVDTPAPGFTIAESDGYTLVFEDGSSDTFTVVLTTQPSANVVIDVSSADLGEVTVSPASLTFTNTNWNDPQPLTLTGVNDSGPDPDGDQTTLITLAIDQANTLDNSFDNLPSQSVSVTTRDVDGSIRGTIWNDVDGNQTQNNGEVGLPGVTVYLDLNRNGQFDGGEPTQLTAADGSYSFAELAAGEYVVAQILPSGLAQTFPQVVGSVGTFAELINNQSSLSVLATHAPRDVSRLFILEKNSGNIRILNLNTGQLNPTPFLTISDVDASANEAGLLGLAFHPDYANNGKFYVNVTVDDSPTANFATHIREYTVSSNPDIADPASVREILSFDQPFGNHNGGWIGFSPIDDFLYVGAGDGGSGGDPLGNGQSLNTLLGKLLRIDVNGDDFPADPDANYAIPASNPFVGTAGAAKRFGLMVCVTPGGIASTP